MTDAWYHVVVVGMDLPGLLYATLAAREGYRVGVLGHGRRPTTVRHRGQTFSQGSDRWLGLRASPVVRQLLADLGLGLELGGASRTAHPDTERLQIVMPGMRMVLEPDGPAWQRELSRELGHEAARLDAFGAWAEAGMEATQGLLDGGLALPPTGLRARARYRKHLGEAAGWVAPTRSASNRLEGPASWHADAAAVGPLAPDASDRVRAVVGAPITLASGLHTARWTPIVLARLWAQLRAGLPRIPGGPVGLEQLLIQKLREQCADVRPDATVERLEVRRGRVVQAQLADRAERLGCELCVANLDPRRAAQLVLPSDRHDGDHVPLSGLEPAAWRVTIHVAVDPAVLPAGLGAETVLVGDPSLPWEGANALWVSRPGAGRQGRDDGHLRVVAHLPARGLAPSESALSRLVDGVVGQLRMLIPWLDQGLRSVHTPALVTRGEVTTVDPHALVPVLAEPAPMTLGTSGVAPWTAYRNLLVAGPGLWSGLGLEGAAFGARQLLAHTRRLVRLKRPLGGPGSPGGGQALS